VYWLGIGPLSTNAVLVTAIFAVGVGVGVGVVDGVVAVVDGALVAWSLPHAVNTQSDTKVQQLAR
jgi:hypothetical protein